MERVLRAALTAILIIASSQAHANLDQESATEGLFTGCADASMGEGPARRVALAMALAEASRSRGVRISSSVEIRASISGGAAKRTLEYSVRMATEEAFLGFEIVDEDTTPATDGGNSVCLTIRAGKEEGR